MPAETTIDFELRSPVDLKKHGVFAYMECLDTEPICLAAAHGTDKPVLWAPTKFLDRVNWSNIKYDFISAKDLIEMVMDSGKVIAQNSMVEYLAWNWIMRLRFGWPELPLEKVHDTMAQLAYHALPMNLEQGCKVLDLPVQKNMTGNKAMRKLMSPRKLRKAEKAKLLADGVILETDPGVFVYAETHDPYYAWHEDPKDIEATLNYCCDDVIAERALHQTLNPLPPKEREIWLLDQKINLRGIQIDVDNVQAIVRAVDAQEAEQLNRFQQLTGGAVSGPRSYVKLKEWVNEQTGLNVKSLDKAAASELIENPGVSRQVKGVLKIKAELSKSSVAKFTAMLDRMSPDGRVRGWSAYHAATTGRWASWGLQLHNNPRDSYGPDAYDQVTELFRIQDTRAMKLLWDDPFFVASRCVRGALTAGPGKLLVCSDFSAIEGRGLAYLAGEDWVLEAYKNGEDLYKIAAGQILGKDPADITKAERQAPGKPSELGFGYGGGIGAYHSMSQGYRLDPEQLPVDVIMAQATDEELNGPYGAKALAAQYLAQNPKAMSMQAAVAIDIIKRRWRAARPNITAFWRGLEDAARAAIKNPGRIFQYNTIKYCVHKKFLKCQLPSGRVMHYFDPRIGYMHFNPRTKVWVFHDQDCTCEKCKDERTSITFMGMRIVDGKSIRQWARLKTYSGKLAENVTQGFCRDLLAESMLRLEKAGYPVVLTVHDEVAAEIDEAFCTPEKELTRFNKIMEIVPPWAAGMPINAEGWTGFRYRK